MAELLQYLWDRAQGKRQVRVICNNVFNNYADIEKRCLSLNDLHVATLRVYSSVNKQFLRPHKEPPSMVEIADTIQEYRSKGTEAINREEFYQSIIAWLSKDLHVVLAHKVLTASVGAPALASITKKAGRKLPGIKDISEKIPTSLFLSIYFVGLLVL